MMARHIPSMHSMPTCLRTEAECLFVKWDFLREVRPLTHLTHCRASGRLGSMSESDSAILNSVVAEEEEEGEEAGTSPANSKHMPGLFFSHQCSLTPGWSVRHQVPRSSLYT